MTQAVASVLGQYARFSGRARRSEFWLWQLFTVLVALVVAAVEVTLGVAGEDGGPVSGLLVLVFLLPNLAVMVRRLHDAARSGWWLLVVLVPVAGPVVLLVLLLLPPTPGADRHGPDPRIGVGTATQPRSGTDPGRRDPSTPGDDRGALGGPVPDAVPTDGWVPPGWDLPPAERRGGRPDREADDADDGVDDGVDDDRGRPSR